MVLPPSFPFGGMENPCLTFVTPTLLAGDRSLADVVAHEITHSWTGNLVTNVNFEHFWLNEGFTRFIEDKIMGRLHGEKTREFNFQAGLLQLEEEVIIFNLSSLTANFNDQIPISDKTIGSDEPIDQFGTKPDWDRSR